MNWILSIILILLFQDSSPQHVKGRGFEGYIYDENHPVFLSVDNQKSRYTPSREDILKAESILKINLENLNKELFNQVGSCPVIHKKLKKYLRQYVGFINKENEKVLWINFVWKKDGELREKCAKDIVSVLDGCSYYWRIKVNITSGKLFDLEINGRS